MRRKDSPIRSWLESLWRLLNPLASAPAAEFLELSPQRTELRHGHVSFILDTRARLMTRNGRSFVRFDEIQTIDLVHTGADDDRPERWRVQLNTGRRSSKTVLVTPDDADASIVGARLATLTGKRVRSL